MSRTPGIIGRLAIVVAAIAGIHIGARLVWYWMEGSPYAVDRVYVNDVYTNVHVNWWNQYTDLEPFDFIMVHVLGAILISTVAMVICGLFYLLKWIVNGSKPYVDPCKDNAACPCQRHRVEEENNRAAQTAAIAAGTAVVVSAAINN